MSRVRRCLRHVAPLCIAVTLVACAEPPTREISQAQGALDAARAAGAETYAKPEFQAADAALRRAHGAVTERDYRGALSFALEAREQARTAAREAAAARARAATDVALEIQVVARTLEDAQTQLTGPSVGREARARNAAALADLDRQLQETRSAMAAGDYGRAAERVRGLQTRLTELMAPTPARPR